MLKIRLKRVGRKHDPSFRVVLVDSHEGPKTGKVNEILGFYDPKKDVKDLKAESIKGWIAKGAQVSDTVHNILVGEKIITGKKINVLPKKSPIVKEVEEKEEKSEAVKASTAEESTEEEKTETPPADEPKTEPEPATETPAESPKEETPAEAPPETDTEDKKPEA